MFYKVLLLCTILTVGEQLDLPQITPVFMPRVDPEETNITRPLNNNMDFSVFRNNSLLVINRSFDGVVQLFCNASYPVTWTLDSVANQWVTSVFAYRTVGNISDSSTYKYSISLGLYRLSGEDYVENFVCHNIENTTTMNLTSTYRIVHEKSTLPFWLHNDPSDQTINYNSDVVIVPCFSLNINETFVELYYRVGIDETLELAKGEEIINYEEYVGYHINSSLITPTSKAGKYMCMLRYLNHDGSGGGTHSVAEVGIEENAMFVFMEDTLAALNITTANFNLEVNEEDKSKGTQLWFGQTFLHYITGTNPVCCDFSDEGYWSDLGISETSCGEPLKCYIQSYRWIYSSYRYTPKWNESCVHRYTRAESAWTPVIQHCVDRMKLISSEESIITGNFEESMTLAHEPSSVIYVGMKFNFTCSANPFYFARGIFWEIERVNKTVELVLGNIVSNDNAEENKVFLEVFFNDTEIRRIGCKAPIWNSTAWFTSNYTILPLESKSPFSPTSKGTSLVQNVSFYSGQTINLDCEFEGVPEVVFDWEQPPDENGLSASPTEYDDYNYYYRRYIHRSTRVITVKALDDIDGGGQYNCTASNGIGTATKIFHVNVTGSSKPTILGGNKETVVFYAGKENQKLNCTVMGVPVPNFEWLRHEQNASEIPDLEIATISSVSHLIFKQVTVELEGDYYCNVTNFRGSVIKKYDVRIRDAVPNRIWLEIYAVVSVILFFIIVGSCFYIYRKKSRQLLRLQVEFTRTLDKSDSMATIRTQLN